MPADPSSAPAIVKSDTTENQIGVLLTEVTSTGSSPITSYELQKDDGRGGSFTTISGGDSSPTLSLRHIVKAGIRRGVAYRFRYRSRNKVGWSGWSPVASLSASTVPTSPPRPTYVSSTDDEIVLAFSKSQDNGGSFITNYELQIDGVIVTDYVFSTHGYSYTVDRTTLTVPTVTLTTGNIYSFRYRAVNANGESLWSQSLSVAFAPKPTTPAAPTRATTGNSEKSIGVRWTAFTGQTIPVQQYVLYVDDGTQTTTKEIYRGSNTLYVMTETTPGLSYTFYVMAINFNAQSDLSTGTTLKSCVAPYSVNPPTLIESTSTTLRLAWTSPGSNGGCSITGFDLFRDDGEGGDINIPVDSATISGNPNLFEHTVTLAALTGKQVRFKLQVSNEMGSTLSPGFLTALVAGLPTKPDSIVAVKMPSKVAFTIPERTDTEILYWSYHVEMDDGERGEFRTISGYPVDSLKTDFEISSGIQISKTYGVRYRIKNSIGWSEYSDVTYILAAEEPSIPSRPTYVSSTSTELVVQFGTSTSNGGAPITSYTIQIDKEDGNGFSDLSTYTDSTTLQTLDIDGTDPTKLQPGQMYRFRSYATNEEAYVSYSHELRIAAAELPAEASPPQWVQSLSNTTSVAVTWSAVPNTQIPTLGYKLLRDGGNDGDYTVIYNGINRPGQRTFVSHNLTTGKFYRFKVVALNSNGSGPESDESLIAACMPPSGLASPVFVSSTTTQITLKWNAPERVNGCGLIGFKLYQGTTSDAIPTAEVDTNLNSNPFARSKTITFDVSNKGTKYRFQLEAFNIAGSVKSGITEVVLAGVPDAPADGPSRIASLTNSTHITIEILKTIPDLKGGTLKRVHVQVDQGGEGNYTDIAGPNMTCVDTIFTITESQGRTRGFRYRIMNENGWSDFSPVSRIAAVSAPSTPPRPQLVSATQLSCTLRLDVITAGIAKAELYINDCDQASEPNNLVTGYTDNGSQYTVTLAEIASLSGGEICAFKLRAIDADGNYADSSILSVAFADKAAKPNAPYKVVSDSTQTSITVAWDEVVGTQTPGGEIRGYRLYMRKANGGEKKIVYERLNLKSIRKFTLTELNTGEEYIFSVQAYQLNGFTDESDSTSIKVCGQPELLYPPVLTYASSTKFELQWEPPLS